MDPNPRAALERQQLRLRERQKFFEDILQPETEFVFPLSHLHLESHRPPIGSISSMEVNVDTLEQVELIDLGDQDGADVFLPCEDPPPTPQTSGMPLCFRHLGPSEPGFCSAAARGRRPPRGAEPANAHARQDHIPHFLLVF
ncbi:dysbindin domain-containing protein 2 isoform X2 [Camelus ferus]|uniref:Dysbindin domain-containing protein 2 isoform X2 n=1 Tax=Camelus ferus TaxID=419612 RepID=A0A8B8RGP4_CAMFR|nr:dysbindin domain-containing protein 2 isoform X2 [Camelus ferus]